jgi:hypothetical protein
MAVPAWKSRSTWYLVATQDQSIPPDAEQMFAQRMGASVVEVAASHVADPLESARGTQELRRHRAVAGRGDRDDQISAAGTRT